jgi:hypothetical protein
MLKKIRPRENAVLYVPINTNELKANPIPSQDKMILPLLLDIRYLKPRIMIIKAKQNVILCTIIEGIPSSSNVTIIDALAQFGTIIGFNLKILAASGHVLVRRYLIISADCK